MQKAKRLTTLALVVVLTACASSTSTHGDAFTKEQTQQVQKGETTSEQLIAIMGQPFSKVPLDADKEQWMYHYTVINAEATSAIVSMKAYATGFQRQFIAVLENGIVVNATYTENPISSTTTSSLLGTTTTTN